MEKTFHKIYKKSEQLCRDLENNSEILTNTVQNSSQTPN